MSLIQFINNLDFLNFKCNITRMPYHLNIIDVNNQLA